MRASEINFVAFWNMWRIFILELLFAGIFNPVYYFYVQHTLLLHMGEVIDMEVRYFRSVNSSHRNIHFHSYYCTWYKVH